MRRILFACAAVVPALVAGCTPAAQPTPSATPVPTVAAPTLQLMCTPEEGGTASPCTQAEYDAMIARDKLYDEAKALLAKYKTEYERLVRAGAGASKELLSMTSGPYTQATEDELAERVKFEGGTYRTTAPRRLVGESRAGSVVALELCSDSSTITITKDGEVLGQGRFAEQRYFFGETPDGLKIVAAQNREVESC
ncbi:hypothetical protein H5397_10295 [Propioniciclava sp. MC1683]|uniref:hypothetical protein n=1 Tax=Propioniciclava sp. MC1683 TaxID=2760309 RepID=UPI0016024F0D|nr:hypothetical protein [Propioniciclava sp. MC1683]MBB1501806.1 hypothetical protein [Propioniciclava sp. MC1683]